MGSDEGVLVKRIKADFKKLGPKHGKMMKAVAAAIAVLSQAEIIALEKDGSLAINVEGTPVTIDVADVEIRSEDIPGWLVATEGAVTVALDITVTENLRREGVARELVNRIQNIRKSRDYEITARINVAIAPSALTDDTVAEYGRQVLAQAVVVAPVENPLDDERLDIDGTEVTVKVTLA